MSVTAANRLYGFADIMPPENINISPTPYIVVALALTIAIFVAIYTLRKRFKERKSKMPSQKELALIYLKSITPQQLQNKEELYRLSTNLYIYHNNNIDQTARAILDELQQYKYHQNPIKTDKKLISKIILYLKGLS